MPVDRHLQRHHGARNGVADLRPRPAVDDLARQMQQQIDQPRRLAPAEQILQQLVLLRTDAGQAGYGSKQRIEQAGAHGANLGSFRPVMPGFMPGIHVFFRSPSLASGHAKSRADIGGSNGYISPARHVRAFGV